MSKISALCFIVFVPVIIVILLISVPRVAINNTRGKNEPDLAIQENIKKDDNGNKYALSNTTFKVSNIISIERFTTIQTGFKSLPYKYWGTDKFIYHQNCFGPQCIDEDYTCAMSKNKFENINAEFVEAIANPKKITYYYEYPTKEMDLYGTGFGLTLADGREIFLAFTPTKLVAACVIGEECLISKDGNKRQPYSEMGYEEYKNIILFEGDKLMDMLIDLNKLQRENYTDCEDIIIGNNTKRPITSPDIE